MMEKGQGFSWVSECGSGIESGWTYYLNESSYLCSGRSGVSRVTEGRGGKVVVIGRDDDDREDGLSLVSDASSGPPHFEEGRSWRSGEDEECENALFWRGKVVIGRERHEDSCFQDTASSAKVSCKSRRTLLNSKFSRRMISFDHRNQKKNSCLWGNEAPGCGSAPLMFDLDDVCLQEINGRNDPRRRQKSLAVQSTK